jgi:hypothetical protein
MIVIVNYEHYQCGSSATICLIDSILEGIYRTYALVISLDVCLPRLSIATTLYRRL